MHSLELGVVRINLFTQQIKAAQTTQRSSTYIERFVASMLVALDGTITHERRALTDFNSNADYIYCYLRKAAVLLSPIAEISLG
jgi:hypothetical protein